MVEEKLGYLIIGDVLSNRIPSLEIQNWLIKYWECSKSKKLYIKAISGFYISLADIKIELFWVESLHDNVKAEIIYPPILRLKLNKSTLALENEALELVKRYLKNFIEFIK